MPDIRGQIEFLLIKIQMELDQAIMNEDALTLEATADLRAFIAHEIDGLVSPPLPRGSSAPERGDHAVGDFVLHREDIAAGAIPSVRPKAPRQPSDYKCRAHLSPRREGRFKRASGRSDSRCDEATK